MSAPPVTEAHLGHSRDALRRSALKFSLLIVMLGVAFASVRFTPLRNYLTVDSLRTILDHLRGAWWAPIVQVAVCCAVGSIGMPATPFLVLGAAIFGPWWGTLWNWTGILLASAIGYGVARHLGRDFVERAGGAKIKKVERLLHRRGFLPLVALRFVPIPFPLINAAAAVVGVRFSKFFAAAALGLGPPIGILTYFSARILEAASGERAGILSEMFLVSLTAAFLVILPIAIRRRIRIVRLKRLRAERAARAAHRLASATAS